jgi:hypothetical protein
VDALYFRVSSERQTTENQFSDLLQVAEKDGSSRDWDHIRQALSNSVYEEQVATLPGGNAPGDHNSGYRGNHEHGAIRAGHDEHGCECRGDGDGHDRRRTPGGQHDLTYGNPPYCQLWRRS